MSTAAASMGNSMSQNMGDTLPSQMSAPPNPFKQKSDSINDEMKKRRKKLSETLVMDDIPSVSDSLGLGV